MSSSNLIRWGGLAAMLGGILIAVAEIIALFTGVFDDMAVSATTTSFALTYWLILLGRVLLLGGLVALYIYQAEAAGILGFVGFLGAFLGSALVVGAGWAFLFFGPILAVEAPEVYASNPPIGFVLTIITAALGWLLFGIATLRARVYPRWAAVLLIVAAIVSFIPIPLSGIVLSVAVIWLGFVLLREGQLAEKPARTR